LASKNETPSADSTTPTDAVEGGQQSPLDRNSPMPLWAQLEAELRRRLEAGEFDEGFFPTDHELTQSYDVSRHTVREAVRHLNKTGLLKRERGRGTVVNRAEFEQSLGTLYSLFQSVESAGVEQNSEVLQLEVVTDTVAASHLDLAEDTQLVLLARLRMAGGRKGDAAFFLERRGLRDGKPIEWRTTIVRGDRFRFVSDWTAGSHSQLRPSAA